uniref:Uncharacterized protein n=1 Tax=Rhizophora mucronata TaxID=61149 RepID=A0A2P2M9K6_RHIMU
MPLINIGKLFIRWTFGLRCITKILRLSLQKSKLCCLITLEFSLFFIIICFVSFVFGSVHCVVGVIVKTDTPPKGNGVPFCKSQVIS